MRSFFFLCFQIDLRISPESLVLTPQFPEVHMGSPNADQAGFPVIPDRICPAPQPFDLLHLFGIPRLVATQSIISWTGIGRLGSFMFQISSLILSLICPIWAGSVI